MSSYHPGIELPAPDADQVAHSTRLIDIIIQQIEAASGVISFRDYMQLCLYQPGLGYYAAGATKFGAAGDFVTAPEISSLFGFTLANHIAGLFNQGLDNHILEIGAGSGKLCVDIIHRFRELNTQWQSYAILETSADLQQRQRQLFEQQLSPQECKKIHWLNRLPDSYNGMVLGNEVLDAMPVNIVLKNEQWIELGVGFENNRFEWKEFSRNSEAVQRIQQIDEDNTLPDQYCTELNINLHPWFKALSKSCDKVVIELIDYGYEQAQYYHPQRSTGTLVCFYQHRNHPDPFIYPGLQDITAFVDFDSVAVAAEQAGFSIDGLSPQAHFLMANGLLELIPAGADEMQQMGLAQQIKTLTLPGEMGEKFKVIGLQKNLQLDLTGL